MTNVIHMQPLTAAKYDTYIKVGSKAYNEHYLNLWKHNNATPYIESSFTLAVLKQEERNPNTSLFLINKKTKALGILKFTLHSQLDDYPAKEALYVDKIYILNAFTGKGIGEKVLHFVLLRAKELGKKIVWLDTMQNGPAVQFYLKNGFSIHSEKMIHFSEVRKEKRPMYIMIKTL